MRFLRSFLLQGSFLITGDLGIDPKTWVNDRAKFDVPDVHKAVPAKDTAAPDKELLSSVRHTCYTWQPMSWKLRCTSERQAGNGSDASTFQPPRPVQLRPRARPEKQGGNAIDRILQRSEQSGEEQAQQGWDPEGLFQKAAPASGGLIARQEARRRAQKAAAPIAAESQVRRNRDVNMSCTSTQPDMSLYNFPPASLKRFRAGGQTCQHSDRTSWKTTRNC